MAQPSSRKSALKKHRNYRYIAIEISTHIATCFAFVLLNFIYLRPIWNISQGIIGGFTDSWMNVFQIWWMREAFELKTNPFFTPLLNHPTGSELYWHTLAPIKNGLGIFLLPWLDLVTTYNVIVFLTFIFSGYTSWLLFRYLCRSVVKKRIWIADGAALIGAIVLNYSPYHLSHAWAHMNLISIEGIPLFILCYLKFKDTRLWRYAIFAGLTALYTALSDYYYLYYLLLFLGFDLLVMRWRKGALFEWRVWLDRDLRRWLGACAITLLFISPIIVALLLHYSPDIINPYHSVDSFYADLLGFIIPHHNSLWLAYGPQSWTEALKLMEGNIEENGFFLGWLTLLIALFAVWRNLPKARYFGLLGLLFALLSLGNSLHIMGNDTLRIWTLCLLVVLSLLFFAKPFRPTLIRDITILIIFVGIFDYIAPFLGGGNTLTLTIPMPFAIFKNVAPMYKMGGMPVRFILLTYLALGACVSLTAAAIASKTKKMWLSFTILAVLGLVPAIEYLNREFVLVPFRERPMSVMEQIRNEPPYVAVLTDDSILSELEVVLHEHPVSTARLSRVPRLQSEKQKEIRALRSLLSSNDPGKKQQVLQELKRYNFKYFITHNYSSDAQHNFIVNILGGKSLYRQNDMSIYQLY